MANKVTTTGQTTFTAKVRTTGQTTFVKKIVIGTPVRSVTQQGLFFTALTDTKIGNASDNEIVVFDSAEQKFVNRDSATLVNLTLSGNVKSNLVPSQDSAFDLGSASNKWKDLHLSGGTLHLGGLDIKDSDTGLSVTDSVGNPVNFSLLGSRSQIRNMFSAGGDLSYNSSSGEFSFDVEQVYTKENFDSDFNIALDSAALEGVGLTYNNATNTLAIDSSELEAFFKPDIRGYFTASNTLNYNNATGDFRLPQPLDSAASPTFTNINIPHSTGVNNGKIIFGDGIDDGLTIHHSTKGKINNYEGDLDLTNFADDKDILITSDNGAGSTTRYFRADGSTGEVKLYHYGTEKFKTSAYGATVTGTINADSGTFTNLTRAVTVDSATYGSASQVPVLTVNTSGFIDSIGTVSVAGVISTSFDSGTGIFTINTADGNSFTTHIQDSADLIRISRAALSATDAGGDGSFTYDKSTGVLTYTGPSASEVRAHLSGNKGLTYNSSTGVFDIDSANIDNIIDSALGEVSVIAGTGLTGGGTIVSDKTLNVVGGKGIIANANDIQIDSDNVRKIFSGGTGVSYNNANGEFSIGQAVGTSDNVTFNQVRGPANFIIDPATVGDNTGTVQILGNLQVEGTQTTINSTAVSINDKNIVLADSASNAAAADGAGITINGADATLTYSATGDKFVFNKPFQGQYLGFDSDFDSALSTSSSTQTIRGYLSGSNSITYNSTTGDIRAPQPLDSAASPTFTNITGTLQTAAQANITSVGNLTALRVDGEIDARGGITDNGGSLILQSSNGFGIRLRNHSGNDLVSTTNAGVAKLGHTGNTKLETTTTGVTVTGTMNADSATIGGPLEVTGEIDARGGITDNAGPLVLQAKSGEPVRLRNHSGDDIITASNAGAAKLNHTSNLKLETTTTGVTVTGTVNADSATFTDNIRADGGNLIMGDDAYSIGDNYVGMKTSFQTGTSDYMIISGTGDGTTYVSAKAGAPVSIRAGGNVATHALQVRSDRAEALGDFALDSVGAVLFDKSEKSLKFGDNYKAVFGAGGDLEISHNGSHSLIQDGGTGQLRIAGSIVNIRNAANSNNMIRAVDGGAVTISHNGSGKLETTSTGATVTGTLNADSATIGNINITGSNINASSGNITIDAQGNNTNIIFKGTDSGVDKTFLTLNGSLSGRALFNENIYIGQNNEIMMGIMSNFRILHDGSKAILKTVVGSDDISLQPDSGGTVELYFNGTKKLETTSTGVDVTGKLIADSAELSGKLRLPQITNALEFGSFAGGGGTNAIDMNNCNIVGVNRIEFNDPGSGEGLSFDNIKVFESPNTLTNAAGNFQVTYNNFRKFTVSDSGAEVVGRLFTVDSAIIDGNGSTSGVGIGDGKIEMRTASGIPAYIDFYCEVNNAHRVRLQSPAHANYGGNPDVILPTSSGTLALTSQIPSSGISSGNVATFTSGVADNDFLRVDGSDIEGRSASEVLSDISAMPLAGGTFTGDVVFNEKLKGRNAIISVNNDDSDKFSTLIVGERTNNDEFASLSFHPTLNSLSAKIDATSSYIAVWSGKNSTQGQRFNINYGTADETVNLRPNAVTRLEANKYGATVTGTMNADSATITGFTRTGGLFSNGSIGNNQSAKGVYAGLSNAGDAQLSLVGDNTQVSPQIDFSHDVGIDYDVRLILENAGNTLALKSHGNENMAKFIGDGAVALYHDNGLKFETTDSGINIFGKIRINNTNLTKTGGATPLLDSAVIPSLQLPASAIGTGVFDSDRLPLGTFGGGGGGPAGSVAADDIATGDAAVTISTNTGNITIDAQEADTDIIFKGTDNTSDIEMLKLDGSEAGYATFNSTVQTPVVQGVAVQDKFKFRYWSSSNVYASGFHSGYTFGGLGDGGGDGYAINWTNSQNDHRGFIWNDAGHSVAEGAMALTTNGKLTVAHSIRVGYGETDTTTPGATHALDVNGSFAATTKSFVIDHPTKEGMKLRHGSLEGPENGVYVRGRLKGRHVINLPDYWKGLVDEETITVNLTPVGNHQGLYVESIENNMVFVSGESNSRIDCFYTVYGERKDVEKMTVEY